jgi:hypothetical protein
MNEITPPVPAHSAMATLPSLLNFLSVAARDPQVDIGKFEALLRMQREILADEAKLAYGRAMAAAQQEIPPIRRDAANTQTRSRYARYETICAVAMPIISRHGFSVSFKPVPPPEPGWISLVCVVSHQDGHREEIGPLSGPPDNTGSGGKINKTALHGMISTTSYLKRNLFCAAFNIVAQDEDDDGNLGIAHTRWEAAPPPPDGPPEEDWGQAWLTSVDQQLAAEENAWKAMKLLTKATTSAPSARALKALEDLPRVREMRRTAPDEAAYEIQVAFDRARARMGAGAPAQPPAQTQPPVQPPAPTTAATFPHPLIDAAGDIIGDEYADAREWAQAYVIEFDPADAQGRAALAEHNADAIADAQKDSGAAAVLASIDERGDVRQNVSPDFAIVEPPVDRGKMSWPGYVRALKAAAADVAAEHFAAWAAAQRPRIETCAPSHRLTAARVVLDAAQAKGIADPPAWIADVIRGRPAEPTADETWVDDIIARVDAAADRAGFEAIVSDADVRRTMLRLRRDTPALFDRADAAFAAATQRFEGQG